MNFEQLRLQMHMRGLYETMGAQDAELMIVEAFVKEQARHEKILQQQALSRKNLNAGIPSV